MDLLEKAEETAKLELCDHCRGRLFAQLGHGLTNEERGKALRVFRSMDDDNNVQQKTEDCHLCSDLCSEFQSLADIIVEELEGLDFETFLVGSRIDPSIEEAEEQLWAELDITTSSPIKSEINREVGKRVDDMLEAEVDLEAPDVKAIIDTRFDTVEIEIGPLFIYGRYRKLSRDIPQTQWDCKRCRGIGCSHCNGKGKMYPTSVEEIIAEPLLEMTEGERAVLHGMGREDIDALMLGDGRPFVIEVKKPVNREVDLQELKDLVDKDGRVEIDSLRFSVRNEIQEIKTIQPEKSYKVTIDLNDKVSRVTFNKVIESCKGVTISQRTPTRVTHRRADKVRKRKIYDIQLLRLDGDNAEISIKCQAGTYVKEFIHGDEGRTIPSLADELDTECNVKYLDVLDVHYEDKEVVK